MADVIDTNLAALSAQTRDYNKTKTAMADSPLPMGTISGPTANTVNAGGAGAPRTRAEFLARGGLGNTVMQSVNNLSKKRDRQKLEGMYETLLAAGEQGAKNAYEDAIGTYSEEIKDWIPSPARFYDAEGVFQPHNYYEKMSFGIDAFKKDKTAKAKQAAEYQAVGSAIGSSATKADAASKVYNSGFNAGDHTGPIGFMNEVKLVTDEDRANAEYKRAQAYKLRKEADGVNPEDDKALNEANKSRIQLRTQANTLSNSLKGLKEKKAKLFTDEFDGQIAEIELQLKDMKDEEKKADLIVKDIAKNQKTIAQQATWGGVKAYEIDPEVSRIADQIDGSIKAFQQNTNSPIKNVTDRFSNMNPQTMQQFGSQPEIVNNFVDAFDQNTKLDPIVKEEVRKELQKRYSSDMANPADKVISSGIEKKAREIWARKGVKAPTPEQLQYAVANIQRQMQGK